MCAMGEILIVVVKIERGQDQRSAEYSASPRA